jgi:hypothetical protein
MRTLKKSEMIGIGGTRKPMSTLQRGLLVPIDPECNSRRTVFRRRTGTPKGSGPRGFY